MRRVAGLLMAALLAGPALAATALPLHPTARAVVQGAIDGAIRPAFAGWAANAGALEAAVTGLCAEPSTEALLAARTAFAASALDWNRAELFKTGPLSTGNRAERAFFWPDRKGIALRQVQALLAGEDASATTVAGLADKSVAVQGYGALEFALYGTGADALASAGAGYRCAYAAAVAGNLAAIAAELSAAWQDPDGIARRLTYPAAEDADFRSMTEVQEELVGLLAHGVETVRDQRLLPFVGRAGEAPKPKSAPFWRSGLTIASVEANLDGLEALFEAAELGQYVPNEYAGIAVDAETQFARAKSAIGRLGGDVEADLASDAGRAALGEVISATQELQRLFGEELPAALGLSVGFSSLDGD
jgi:uncharacterized protein